MGSVLEPDRPSVVVVSRRVAVTEARPGPGDRGGSTAIRAGAGQGQPIDHHQDHAGRRGVQARRNGAPWSVTRAGRQRAGAVQW